MGKDYKYYQVKDLMQDEDFLHWMKHRDEASTRFWHDWLLKYPQKAEILTQACQLYEFLHLQEEALSTQADEQEVLDRIQQTLTTQSQAEPSRFRNLYVPVLRWAAVIILLAGISFALYNQYNKQPDNSWITLQSVEKVRHITLPDGTLVSLNQHSSCRYSSQIQEADKREVWIEGEAFLEVSHQATKEGLKKAFVVHIQSIDVEVLGTRFNVINAPARQNVVLEKGSVRVNQKGQAFVLKPGEMAHVSGSRLLKSRVNPNLYTGWLKGKLQLDNTTLQEIIQLLEYKYGYAIEYPKEHPFLQQRMSGSLDIKDQQDLFHTLSLAFAIQINQQDKHITITPEKPVTKP